MFVPVYRPVQTWLFLSAQLKVPEWGTPLTGWRKSHGLQPTERAMAKIHLKCLKRNHMKSLFFKGIYGIWGRHMDVDNRPSTDKLYHLVRKKKKIVTCDTWHVTRDTWHDTWHMTCDMFGGVNILSKFQLPSSYGLWFMILWISGGKGWLNQLINQWITRLFIEQPRLHRVC